MAPYTQLVWGVCVVRKAPVSVFTNFPAGGEPAGLYQGRVAAFIEEHTGFAFCELSDGMHASSVGTSIGVPLFAKHPDDPTKPRFSAAQTSGMCEEYSQLWLGKKINFLLQHIQSLYRKDRAHHLFLDDKIVEETLNKFMGDVTFADLMQSVFISGHSLSTEPDKVAVMFSRIAQSNGNVTYSHSPNLKVVQTMQGSMAVPGAFSATNIEGVGDISDFAMIYSADRAFRTFRRNLEPGTPVQYLELGAPRFFGVNSVVFNRHSMLGLLTKNHFFRAVSNQSYSNAIQGIREEIGDDNVYDLTPRIHLDRYSGRGRVTEDILDASKQSISLIKEFAEDYIEQHRDAFMRVADALGENRILRTAPAPEPIMIKKPQTSIWDGMRSFFSPKPVGGEAAPALH